MKHWDVEIQLAPLAPESCFSVRSLASHLLAFVSCMVRDLVSSEVLCGAVVLSRFDFGRSYLNYT